MSSDTLNHVLSNPNWAAARIEALEAALREGSFTMDTNERLQWRKRARDILDQCDDPPEFSDLRQET